MIRLVNKLLLGKSAWLGVLVAVLILTLSSGISQAIVYDLTAGVTTFTNPDNPAQTVTMWGYGLTGGAITVPGPVLTVPAGDTTLTINLINNLPQNTSLIIPGLQTALSPTNVGGRVMSFTQETTAGGGTGVYTWTNVRPGTQMYQSGTNPAVQVQMGLYGAVTKNFSAGPPQQAYNAATSYNSEAILFYSEIDPAFHQAVASGQYGVTVTSAIDYKPKFFLINGRAYSATTPPVPIAVTGPNILLRFLNAGLQTHVPLFPGGKYMTIYAENGYLYPYPKERYSAILPAGSTLDAVITLSTIGLHPLMDRRLNLANAANSPGGMLTYLNYGGPVYYYLPLILANTI